MVFLVCIAIAAYGMQKNIKEGESYLKCHLLLPNFLAGLCAAVALIGICMKAYGSAGKTGMIIGGLIGTIIFDLPDLKQALELSAFMKTTGETYSGKLKFQIGPFGTWLNSTLIGLGKVMKLVMYCTIIGIPLYRMCVNMMAQTDAYLEQVELRQRKEAMDKIALQNSLNKSGEK